MPLDINVTSDVKKLHKSLTTLEQKALPKIIARSLNRTAAGAQTASTKHIAPMMHARQTDVKKSIHITKANYNKWWSTLTAQGKPLPLIAFKAKQTKQGVKAKAWGKTTLYKNSFIAKVRSNKKRTKNVFVRKNKTRLPIKKLWGPGISQLFKKEKNISIITAKVHERFIKELINNTKYYLNKLR